MSFIPQVITGETGKRVYSLMLELVKIPSITSSEGGEDACAEFIFDRLSQIEYFRRSPEDLRFIELKDDPLGRHSVGALLRAGPSVKNTIILLGHFDVVDVDVCGPLREWAFDPAAYTARIGKMDIAEDARADLESGNYIFGRGVSDMKAGIALAMCFLEAASGDAAAGNAASGDAAAGDAAAGGADEADKKRDFNVLFLAVPDEEGDSVGMRGSVPYLAELREKEGLDFLACVNLEPAFEDGSPAVYFGTIGKYMPLYLCVGKETHASEYYDGLNSTLIASYLNISLDGGRDTIETLSGQTFPPYCCLRMRDARERYAVTLPERTVLYYNCLTVNKTPAVLLEEMKAKASSALDAALSHIGRGDWKPRVLTVKEVLDKAYGVAGEELFSGLPDPEMDERDRNVGFLSHALDVAGEKGPLVVVGFTPPFYPPRSNRDSSAHERAVRRAAADIGGVLKGRGFNFKEMEIFKGITDLSYTGFQGGAEDLGLLADNMPLWGRGYGLPMEDLLKIDVPCVVFGPIGKDAHKITERVELDYSFNVLPAVLKDFLGLIAGHGSDKNIVK